MHSAVKKHFAHNAQCTVNKQYWSFTFSSSQFPRLSPHWPCPSFVNCCYRKKTFFLKITFGIPVKFDLFDLSMWNSKKPSPNWKILFHCLLCVLSKLYEISKWPILCMLISGGSWRWSVSILNFCRFLGQLHFKALKLYAKECAN